MMDSQKIPRGGSRGVYILKKVRKHIHSDKFQVFPIPQK